MEQVQKTFCNPLATSNAQVHEILRDLAISSTHPFSPEQLLLIWTVNSIHEINISSMHLSYDF
ncbi:hypothetical protein BDW75DRAFT_225044 [Aspergillus navahoensis]